MATVANAWLLLQAVAPLAHAERITSSYTATHVTRLHRYDHSGIESMLEAEAQWHSTEHPQLRGSSLPSFVRLSRRQVEGLRRHHEEALVQLGSFARFNSSRSQGVEAAVLKDAHRYRAKSAGAHDGPAVTGLSSLASQYVGPIGVGTVRAPQGCLPADSNSLIYLSKADMADTPTSELQSCHVEDQSQVWVVFDTGSTNIWVSSDLCKQGACAQQGRMRYDHTVSNTYVRPKDGVTLNIQFGTGKISGPQAIDDFHIGPFTVYNQTFGMIQEQEGRVFEEVPFEGILGLAFPRMSANHATPFFDSIIQQKALKRNQFAFYFSPEDPAGNAVFWGGVDKSFHQGEVKYFPVVDPYYWSLGLKSFRIGDEELLGSGKKGNAGSMLETGQEVKAAKAIVDTGTTFFTAEGGLFEQVMNRLPAVQCSKMTAKSHPPILYRIAQSGGDHHDFVLEHSEYMTGNSGGEDDYCSPAFMKIDIPAEHGPAMVLGEVFLRQYFSIYDRGDGAEKNGRVGFARSAQGQHVKDRLKELTHAQPAFSRARQ